MNGNIIEREIRKRHLFPSRVTFNQTEKDDHFRKRCNDLQIGLVNAGGGNRIEDWAEYRSIDFCVGAYLWKLRAKGKSNVSIMAEDYGIVGTQDVSTEGFKEFSGALMQKVSGIQSVWLLIKGEGIAIDWFGFE